MAQKMEWINRFVFLLPFALLASCSDQQVVAIPSPEVVHVDTSTKFSKLVDECLQVELPYQMNCEDCCGPLSTQQFDPELLKYMPEGATLMGKVMHEGSFAVFLVTYAADWIIPSICVFNDDGQLQDEETFMTKWCGTDFGFFGNQNFSISQDFIFSEIDTNYTFLMDSADYNILDTVKTEIIRRDFVIDDGGQIVEQTFDTIQINTQTLIECRHDDRIACVTNLAGDTIVELTNYYHDAKYADLNGDRLVDICVSMMGTAADECVYYLFNSMKKKYVYLENCYSEQASVQGTDLYFSYHAEGCAGGDWSSDLNKIVNDTLVNLGILWGSNCHEDAAERWLVEAYRPAEEPGGKNELIQKWGYNEFIPDDQNRYEYIRKYWINNHSRFE